jgi:hypothetical protein
MPTRAEVVACARSYVGTKFVHQGRRLGQALDCVGLILCVGEDLAFEDKNGVPLLRTDYPDYPAQPKGRFVHDECVKRLVRKSILDLKPGDVITLRLPTDPCHTAIIGEIPGQGLSMIHCYDGGRRKCIEHRLDEHWQRRIVGAFEFPGIEE